MQNYQENKEALSRLNIALIESGFSKIDIDKLISQDILAECASRRENNILSTNVIITPNRVFIRFIFGEIKKCGSDFAYPAPNSTDEEIEHFIDDIMSATDSLED